MNKLELWTVYDNPADFPGKVVARKFVLDKPTSDMIVGESLEEVRSKIPGDKVRIPRDPSDPPAVVETWI